MKLFGINGKALVRFKWSAVRKVALQSLMASVVMLPLPWIPLPVWEG
jgi:hypothetical protein